MVRADGPQVAVVNPDHTVHFQRCSWAGITVTRWRFWEGSPKARGWWCAGNVVRENTKVRPVLVAKGGKG